MSTSKSQSSVKPHTRSLYRACKFQVLFPIAEESSEDGSDLEPNSCDGSDSENSNLSGSFIDSDETYGSFEKNSEFVANMESSDENASSDSSDEYELTDTDEESNQRGHESETNYFGKTRTTKGGQDPTYTTPASNLGSPLAYRLKCSNCAGNISS